MCTCIWHTCTRYVYTYTYVHTYVFVTHKYIYSHIDIHFHTYVEYYTRNIRLVFNCTTIVSLMIWRTVISRTPGRASCGNTRSVTVCRSRETLFGVTTWPATVTDNKRSAGALTAGMARYRRTRFDKYSNNRAGSSYHFNKTLSLSRTIQNYNYFPPSHDTEQFLVCESRDAVSSRWGQVSIMV